jgi:hypothetical protein
MTRREIMISVLAEVSGKPEALITELVKATEDLTPNSKNNLDTELPEAEAQDLMRRLLAERQGILRWLEQGARLVESTMPRTDLTQ